VSSDPFTDLASSLEGFRAGLRDLVVDNRLPAPGSPAVTEANGEPYAGEWGQTPSQEVFSAVFITAVSCGDHLAAIGAVIRARCGTAPPYTLARAATEAASIAFYLTAPTINALERVRRNLNFHLDSMCEELSLLSPFTSPEAQARANQFRTNIAAIGRGAQAHHLQFRKMDGPGRAAYIGDRPPRATTLIDQCASQLPGLGATYQRLLSSITHAKLNGLARFLMSADTDGQGELNITAGRLALELLAAPLCATAMTERLCWFTGWDTKEIEGPVNLMLDTWGRVANAPAWRPQPFTHSGPVAS
jgi:hypothetical protein